MFDKISVSASSMCSYLAELSNIKIGGQPTHLYEPESVEDLTAIYAKFASSNLPVIPVGGASNLLFAGQINAVLVTDRKLKPYLHVDGDMVVASANTDLHTFVEHTASQGLAGLDFLYGVPAHIGGTVFMNAGAWRQEISHWLQWIELVNATGVHKIPANQLNFGYRTSGIKGFITKAAFKLQKQDKEQILANMEQRLNQRRSKHPMDYPNLGSFFKNPQRTPAGSAGRLIETCGLKGTSIGGAQISEKHANFIINRHNASFDDILELVELAKTKVLHQHGVKLELEVKVIK